MKVDWEKRAQTGLLLSIYMNGLVPVSTSWLRGVKHMLALGWFIWLGIVTLRATKGRASE